MDQPADITGLLAAWRCGRQEALEDLTPIVYAELHRLARVHLRKEGAGHTLQTTALVHEAFLRLVKAEVSWNDRVHFFSIASNTMRRVLVDHARAQRRHKRGGDAVRVTLDEARAGAAEPAWDMIDLDAALERLGRMAPRQVRAIELRFFGGLSDEEIARALDVGKTTVRSDIRLAKAWLHRELSG